MKTIDHVMISVIGGGIAVSLIAAFVATRLLAAPPAEIVTIHKADREPDKTVRVIPLPIKTVPIQPKPALTTLAAAMPTQLPEPPEPPAPALKKMPETAAAPPEDDDKPVQRRRYYHAQGGPNDVCARHGMHKVFTHGGRSWRCR